MTNRIFFQRLTGWEKIRSWWPCTTDVHEKRSLSQKFEGTIITKNCKCVLKPVLDENLIWLSQTYTLPFFWSNCRSSLLAQKFVYVIFFKVTQVCQRRVYGSSYFRNLEEVSSKNIEDIMIISIIWYESKKKLVISTWICHESWQPSQKTLPTCRYHGNWKANPNPLPQTLENYCEVRRWDRGSQFEAP